MYVGKVLSKVIRDKRNTSEPELAGGRKKERKKEAVQLTEKRAEKAICS